MKFRKGRDWKKIAINSLAVIIALIVGVYGWLSINKRVAEASKTVSIPVLARNIDPYSKINREDLTTINVSASIVDANTAANAEELVNKVTIAPIYKDKPIDKRLLVTQDSSAGNYYVVGVNVDPTRSAGVQPGDLVNVYWIQQSNTQNGQQLNNVLMAAGVRVLKVCDDKGQPIDTKPSAGNTGVQGAMSSVVATTAKPPSIVYLAVKPEEASRVVGGASPKNVNLALVKIPNANSIKNTTTTETQVLLPEGSEVPNGNTPVGQGNSAATSAAPITQNRGGNSTEGAAGADKPGQIP
ncbi:MAG: hypothetical protein HPY50_02315 [Firmicutes bacterium]|nr:hypothetical protein [Bacillota bacterium]